MWCDFLFRLIFMAHVRKFVLVYVMVFVYVYSLSLSFSLSLSLTPYIGLVISFFVWLFVFDFPSCCCRCFFCELFFLVLLLLFFRSDFSLPFDFFLYIFVPLFPSFVLLFLVRLCRSVSIFFFFIRLCPFLFPSSFCP